MSVVVAFALAWIASAFAGGAAYAAARCMYCNQLAAAFWMALAGYGTLYLTFKALTHV